MVGMRTRLPAWLNPTSTQIGLETAVDQVGAQLNAGKRLLWITGDNVLAVTGVAVRRVSADVVGVRLAGCEQCSDALLVLGWALRVPNPGVLADIEAGLRTLENTAIVVDTRGAPKNVAEALLEAVVPISKRCRWILIASRRIAPVQAIDTGDAPRPMLGVDPASLPLASHALAWLPAGVHCPSKGLGVNRVAGIGRVALWPEVAEALRQRSGRNVGDVAGALADDYSALLVLAVDGLQQEGAVPADAFALRWIGRRAHAGAVAGQATIAAARLLLRWGQALEARALISAGLERALTMGAPAGVRALLQWADARVCIASGDPYTAAARFSDAAATLRAHRSIRLLACMTRRWADVLTVRGNTRTAAGHYRDARALYRQVGDAAGVGATLRGAADLSVAAGELVSAEALYEQVDAGVGAPVELANLRLGQSVLALQRGEHHRALTLIEAAVRTAPHVPMVMANAQRRRADVALRMGQHAEAARHALDARHSYARVGANVASSRCTRLMGDIAAVHGDLHTAAGHYRDAIVAQIRSGDSVGLRISLTHAVLLEEFSGAQALAGELRRMLNNLSAAKLQ